MCYYELKVVPQLHLVIIHVPCIINNYPAVYMQQTYNHESLPFLKKQLCLRMFPYTKRVNHYNL